VVSQEDERNRRHSGSSSQRPLGQSSRVAFRLTGTSSRQVGFTSPHPGWLNAGALSLKGNEAKPSVSPQSSLVLSAFFGMLRCALMSTRLMEVDLRPPVARLAAAISAADQER